MTTGYTYRLDCGHAATVPGPLGATTGRAWCDECGESVPTGHTLPRSLADVTHCERCEAPGALVDAHGRFCQGCRDQDGGDH